MIITPDLEYPIVCVNIRRGFDGRSLKLDMINLNSSANWFHSDELEAQQQLNDGYATVIPRHELMNVRAVTQLERDTILVSYDSKLVFGCRPLAAAQPLKSKLVSFSSSRLLPGACLF